MRVTHLPIALTCVALAACSGRDTPSVAENRALDEAERMLDEAPDNLAGIDENMLVESDAGSGPARAEQRP